MSKAINNIAGDIYIGKGAGSMILEDMLAAKKSIRVMSPYLSAKLVDVLLDRLSNRVHIELITSDSVEDHKYTPDKNAYKIVRQHTHIDQQLKSRKQFFHWTGIGVMVLFGFFALLKLPDVLTPLVTLRDIVEELIFIGLASAGHFTWKQSKTMRFHYYSYSPLFPLKIFYSYYARKTTDRSRSFTLHSKLYIIDDRIAYLGSVNFTTSGHKYNHESRIRITDPHAVRQLKEEFEELLSDEYYNHRSVTEWGRELYEGIFEEESKPVNR